MKLPLHWHTEPLLLLLVVGVCWAYAMICGPLRVQLAPGMGYPRGYAIRFYLGIAAAFIAVGSPLDQLGEAYLFSAHMLQHMLLIYVAAPLVVTGLPPEILDSWLLRHQRICRALRLLTHPLVAAVGFNFCFSVWHFPELYEWALRDRTIHIIEHASMFFPALLLVWPLVSRSKVLPPLGHGTALLYCFGLMVADLPLWAVLIFDNTQPLYETYRLAPRIFRLDALQDQVLGAVIMKLFNEVFSLWHMASSFFGWYREER